jgi:hypothetical protein
VEVTDADAALFDPDKLAHAFSIPSNKTLWLVVYLLCHAAYPSLLVFDNTAESGEDESVPFAKPDEWPFKEDRVVILQAVTSLLAGEITLSTLFSRTDAVPEALAWATIKAIRFQRGPEYFEHAVRVVGFRGV